MMSQGRESFSGVQCELYELTVPGDLVGKLVIDGAARIVGIVRSVKLTLPPARIEIVVKGLEVEFSVDISNVSAVGSVVQLKNVAKEAEPLEIKDAQRLRKELIEEIRTMTSNIS
ncbi:MAG: hypothetical protein KIH01_06655 [Candidatus Freyarchaeota archaeon]|nr:hypothetical protein [Candidatus Jordarchaeia archaeon]